MDNTNQTPSKSQGSALGLRLFGVPVRFHFTFVLFVIFLGVVGLEGPSGAKAAIYVLALFGSVLLHELGHALVSRRYGIRTVEIVMFPIGGVAKLERNPKPSEELWIALAGPAVNVVIAAALIAIAAGIHGSVDWVKVFAPQGGNLLGQIATGNVALAIFNLLPAFPMDGGRVLRSMLALKYGEARATELAAKAGRFLAICMGLYGLLSASYMLIFIAFFVYLGAAQESAAMMGRQLTQGVPVSAAMVTDYRTLSHGQTVRDAADLLLATSQQDFPVMNGTQVIGLLSRGTLLRAMAQQGPESYVAGVMERDFLRLDPAMDLSEAMMMLAQAGTCALVMEGNELRGLLTSENLTEFLLLRRLDRANATES
ncbi:MAG: site-2 protease family protein [Bryobacterales bacterium]|nr:site-2 protease family protein [Bryobacterales bacterium]